MFFFFLSVNVFVVPVQVLAEDGRSRTVAAASVVRGLDI